MKNWKIQVKNAALFEKFISKRTCIAFFLNPQKKFDKFLYFLVSILRGVFRIQSHIWDGGISKNSQRLNALTFFVKHSMFDVLKHTEYAVDFLSAVIMCLGKCTKQKVKEN